MRLKIEKKVFFPGRHWQKKQKEINETHRFCGRTYEMLWVEMIKLYFNSFIKCDCRQLRHNGTENIW